MKTKQQIIDIAISTINMEGEAINKIKSHIDISFADCIEKILFSTGRVVILGQGQSAIIAKKIVATLNSTGTPALFMHVGDAIQGDLGMIRKKDVVICMSNSGNTPEIRVLIPMLRSLGAFLVAMAGNLESYLAKQADLVINTTVEPEAISGNQVPTASTTAQLVMGDALAVALLEARGFTIEDFARYHPGGSLANQMYLNAARLYPRNERPEVDVMADIETVTREISAKRLGATAVTRNGQLAGIITDGDLRRMLQGTADIASLKASDIMSELPKTITPQTLAVEALQIMRQRNMNQLLVVEDDDYLGMVHLHDILNEGIL
ncbi:MAG: KpsF/GutQ family sugar-phosphate isomerase [Bacteroidales bacterium]